MKKIILNTLNGYCLLDLEKVLYFEADSGKSKVILNNGLSAQLNKSLQFCAELMVRNQLPFCRINRSQLVNIQHAFQYSERNLYQLTLNNGNVLKVTRRRREQLMQVFKKVEKESLGGRSIL